MRDNLLDCTLVLFRKCSEYFGCGEGLQKNAVIDMILKGTHSDEAYKVFTKEAYAKIKKERTFKSFMFSETCPTLQEKLDKIKLAKPD